MTQSSQILNNIHVNILEYVSAGFRVFPVSGKIPTVKAWQKIEYSAKVNLNKFSANFGVALDNTHLVVDVDPRNFALKNTDDPNANRVNSFDALCAELKVDLMKECKFIVQTGSGGHHLYFTKSDKILIKNSLKEYPGVEFKSIGQYVVGYGSIHPTTKATYKIIKGSPAELSSAPDILLSYIQKKPYDFINHGGIVEFQNDPLSIERFNRYLDDAPIAIEGENGDKQTFEVACKGRDLGLHPHTTFECMCKNYNERCDPPWDLDDLRDKVKNAYRYAQNDKGILHPKADFIPLVIKKEDIYPHTSRTGELLRDLHNVCNIIVEEGSALVGLFGYNLMTHRIEFVRAAPWHKNRKRICEIDDYDVIQMKAYISRYGPFEPSTILMREAIMVIAKMQEFHPVKDYLHNVKWDGKHRTSTWLIDYAGAENNEYVKAVSQKLLVAMVARIFEPGYKFDNMCILEGPQGLKKSMLWEALAGEYYMAKSLDTQNKDFLVSAMTSWVVEIADMATNRHSDVEHIKAFLSTRVDDIRMPYAHYSRPIPRQFIITGTKNLDTEKLSGYLSDITGNRRFWIIPVKGIRNKDGVSIIDIQGFKDVRDQLFAEAYVLYQKNFKVYFDDVEIIQMAEEIQESRMGRDPWFDRINEWVLRHNIKDREVVTTMDVFCECLGGQSHHCGFVDQKRIGQILKLLNFKYGSYWDNTLKTNVRGYKLPDVFIADIDKQN